MKFEGQGRHHQAALTSIAGQQRDTRYSMVNDSTATRITALQQQAAAIAASSSTEDKSSRRPLIS